MKPLLRLTSFLRSGKKFKLQPQPGKQPSKESEPRSSYRCLTICLPDEQLEAGDEGEPPG